MNDSDMKADGYNRNAADGQDAVVVENVRVGYGDSVVLDDVSFRIGKGESFAVLGPSGCGKSTMLNAMIGLLPVQRGRISVAGTDVTAACDDVKELHRRLSRYIGVLFQNTALMGNRTIAENVAMPLQELTDLPDELIRGTVDLSLDLVGLGDYANAFPSELSGGMLRRAGLARAMAFNPNILFCDEPSAGLDPATAREIDLVLHELNRDLGVTLVVITHELGSIQNLADRCLMLDKQEKGILASGTLKEIRRAGDKRVKSFFQRRISGRQREKMRRESTL